MSAEVERDQRWVDRRFTTSLHCVAGVDKQPAEPTETTSGRLLNGRSPTPLSGDLLVTPETAAPVPGVKDSWSPIALSRRDSLESVASDCLSDTWSSMTSLPRQADVKKAGIKVEKTSETTDDRTIIVVTDSSSPATSPPTSGLTASSSADKEAGVPFVGSVPESPALAATDESVVRKLECFVESMNVRRCAKQSKITRTGVVTSSSSSGHVGQSFPVVDGSACRPLVPLNGLRAGSTSVLLPFYLPFKTSDSADHPLDLSAKTTPSETVTNELTGALVQADDDVSEAGDDGISSLESLQKQFGENSTMLERIGVRRHTVSGVAQMADRSGRLHGAASPLNGVGLYGPALNEPCIPPAYRSVSNRIPGVADPDCSRRCPPTDFESTRAMSSDRRSGRRLVRGQDAWMNGVSGRQRRSSVLRCLECNMSFWSLPELTLHMIKTAHYANIVRTSVVPGPPVEMTSSPTMMSSCSPIDSNSDCSHESDTDVPDHRVSQQHDVRSVRLTKRRRESSPNSDDWAARSKIWRPDGPLTTTRCPPAPDRSGFPITFPDGRVTPALEDLDGRQPSGLDRDRVVTSSKSPEGKTAAPLYDWSLGRSEDAEDDGTATRQPALTAMEDFISRSICELDRGKRRPPIPLMPLPPSPTQQQPLNGLPAPISVADLMFPLFPLAHFFPEQFLIASRAVNFLPLMQSMARLYGDRVTGLDIPLGPPVDFPPLKTTDDDLRSTRRPTRHRTPVDVDMGSDRKEDFSMLKRVDGGELKSDSRRRQDKVTLRPTLTEIEDRRSVGCDIEDHQKLSPTSSDLANDRLPSTALDGLRGFVYGDRKRSAGHGRGERRCCGGQREGHQPQFARGPTNPDDEEPARRIPYHSPSVSSGGDSVAGALSPGVDCRPDAAQDGTICADTRTNDYDSRFDKYYRLARELAGQLQ